MDSSNEFLKEDYLSIPIEMYKCEVIIRKNKELSNLEKFTLKLIYENNSLKFLIDAFNVGPYVMNIILAKLFYRGLIKLKLDKMEVELSNKIKSCVENNKLDDYLDKEPIHEIRTVTLIQEKVGGELFSGNSIKEFLNNPGSLTTNYIDIKASAPGSFPDIQNFSLNKYVKCIRNDIKAEPEDIEKINFIRPLFYMKLYIPLIQKEGKKFLDLDYDYFPRHVQKVWQNSYETQYELEDLDSIELIEDEDQFISNTQFKLHFLQNLILLEDDLVKYYSNKENLNLRYELEEDFENLNKKFQKFKNKIQSINKIKIISEPENYKKVLTEHLIDCEDFIIICSPEFNKTSISYLSQIINTLLKNNIFILIVSGTPNLKSGDNFTKEFQDFERILKSKIERKYRSNLNLFLSHFQINLNFILNGKINLITNDGSFLNWDYDDIDTKTPTIIFEGGTLPTAFFEYLLDLLPNSLDYKKELYNFNLNLINKTNDSLSDERINFLNKFEGYFKELKLYIQMAFIDGVKGAIGKLKGSLDKIQLFDTVSIINDYEIEDILIDTMKEIREKFLVITDEIDKDKIGPNFEKHLIHIPKFEIILNKRTSKQKEELWNLGISKLESIKDKHENISYNIIEDNYKLNLIYIQKNIIIFSNHRFLSLKRKKGLRFQSKDIGLIISSKNIDEIYRHFTIN